MLVCPVTFGPPKWETAWKWTCLLHFKSIVDAYTGKITENITIQILMGLIVLACMITVNNCEKWKSEKHLVFSLNDLLTQKSHFSHVKIKCSHASFRWSTKLHTHIFNLRRTEDLYNQCIFKVDTQDLCPIRPNVKYSLPLCSWVMALNHALQMQYGFG